MKKELKLAAKSFLEKETMDISMVTDYEELMSRWVRYGWSVVEPRMFEVNKTQLQSVNYDELLWRRRRSFVGHSVRNQIVVRQIKLNEICTDYKILAGRENKEARHVQKEFKIIDLIGDRMSKLNEICIDYERLVDRLSILTLTFNLKSQIETQMLKLNERELGGVTDDQLMFRWQNASFGSSLQDQIHLEILKRIEKKPFQIKLFERSGYDFPFSIRKKLISIAKEILS